MFCFYIFYFFCILIQVVNYICIQPIMNKCMLVLSFVFNFILFMGMINMLLLKSFGSYDVKTSIFIVTKLLFCE